MLKKRIIPVLLWDGLQAVKPVSFERPYRKLGAMEHYIQVMERRNIDELIIIDIEATPNKRKPNYVKLRQFCDNLYCPVTYGGGISTLDDIRDALNNGADKVALNTYLPHIGKEASEKFGKQAIVAVCNHAKGMWVTGLVQMACIYGAGEILLTHFDLDGTMEGYDYSSIEEAKNESKVPIIANGGCGSPEHMAQALDAGASAVAAGSMFLYSEWTPKLCADYLKEHGYAVR